MVSATTGYQDQAILHTISIKCLQKDGGEGSCPICGRDAKQHARVQLDAELSQVPPNYRTLFWDQEDVVAMKNPMRPH